MTDLTMPPNAPPAGQSAVVVEDTACRSCRYNLRGMPIDARCPECGTLVGLSVQSDRLRNSSPPWIRTLRRGALCVLWSVVLYLFVWIAAVRLKGASISPLVLRSASFAVGMFHLAGVYLLTTPDPGGLGEQSYGRSRKLVRLTLFVSLIELIVEIPVGMTVFPPAVALGIAIANLATSIVGIVGLFALFTYLAKLAQRLPDDAIARRARRSKFGISITYGLFVVTISVMSMLRRHGGAAALAHSQIVLGTLGLLVLIPLPIFGIMYLLMLGALSRRLRDTAREAEQLWNSGGAPRNIDVVTPAVPSLD